MSTQQRGSVEMSIAMTISGTVGWFVLLCGESVPRIVLWRCVFASITLLIACSSMGMLHHLRNPRVLLLASLSGVAVVTNWLLLFNSYARTSISIGTAIYNTYPFMLLALGALVFGEKVTTTKVLWLSASFGGVLLIAFGSPGGIGAESRYFSGVLMALGAALCYALSTVLIKKLSGTPPHVIALVQVLLGMVLVAPIARATPSTTKGWVMIATIGVVHTGLVYILLYGAVQKLDTHATAALSFIYPAVAILVDLTALGRKLFPLQIAGAGVIFLSVAAMTLGNPLRKSASDAALPSCD